MQGVWQPGRQRAWQPAILCALLGFGWQALTVHFNYQGNFTALFCSGAGLPIPPQLSFEHIYKFAGSTGYDGQYYHYVAHDPLDLTAIGHSLQDTNIRYPRILLPGLAWLLALGQQRYIDAAYFACNLAFLYVGAWWLAQLLIRRGVSRWWAMLYLLVPATLISLDRMVTDLALTSLCLGFLLYLKDPGRWKLLLVIALAALCRDTGFCLALACCIPLAAQRRFRACLPMLTALCPAVLWYLYLAVHLPREHLPITPPLQGLLGIVWHAGSYPFPPWKTTAVTALDYLELTGLLLAIGLALRGWRKALTDPVDAACLLWALIGLMLPPQEVYSGARILSPLMLYQFLQTSRIPLYLTTPRILAQLAPQAMAILVRLA